jgi:hypothetical protein
MTRQFAKTTVILTALALGTFCGCQKPMGGTASGPFAPAGNLGPASGPPLIPFGPMGGATRVPPPPTGSTRASNAYSAPSGPASASMDHGGVYDSFATAPSGFGDGSTFVATPTLPTATRNATGGMPVIDLTAATATAQQNQLAAAYQPVGSGVSANQTPPGGWQAGVVQTSMSHQPPNISVPPGDLAARLRPLDSQIAAGAVPMLGTTAANTVPYDNFTAVAAAPLASQTQYRNDPAESPAWQAVQPVTAYAPSTDPHNGSQSNRTTGGTQQSSPNTPAAAATMPNDNLLWRNPAVAR